MSDFKHITADELAERLKTTTTLGGVSAMRDCYPWDIVEVIAVYNEGAQWFTDIVTRYGEDQSLPLSGIMVGP